MIDARHMHYFGTSVIAFFMSEHAIKTQQRADTMQGSMHRFNRNTILVWFTELCSSSTVVSNQKCLRNYDGLKSLNSNNIITWLY